MDLDFQKLISIYQLLCQLKLNMNAMAFFDVTDDVRIQKRLEQFHESQLHHRPFVVDLINDVKLYQVALDKRLSKLVKIFARSLAKESFETKVKFVNRVFLLPYEDELDKPIKILLSRSLEFATTKELMKFPIQPDLSERHQHFRYHQLALLDCRKEMVPLDKTYSAPHVMLSLFDDPEGYPAKYFNGNRWCRLQVNDFLEENLSHLNLHQFVVAGEKLFFVFEKKYLGVLHLFHNSPVIKIPLPSPVPSDTQLCSDGENVVLLTEDLNMIKVLPDANSVFYRVSDWRKLDHAEYRVVLNDAYLKVLQIKTPEEAKTLNICVQKTYDRLIKLEREHVCTYTIAEHKLYQQSFEGNNRSLFELREDIRGECHYVLVERKVLEDFLSRMSPESKSFSLKRKLEDPGLCYRETEEKLEEMDFSNVSIS